VASFLRRETDHGQNSGREAMRLAPLLAAMSEDDLHRLAIEHDCADDKIGRSQLCGFLEGTIRSFHFVSTFLINRQPPAFSILSLLLDAPGYESPLDGFRERVIAETERIKALLDSGDLLSRDDGLRLYRSALAEARRNDRDINESEAGLLAALRREANIFLVEHFLIGHHRDLREFWDRPDCFEHEQQALRSSGLLFERESRVLLPEDLTPALHRSLGIDMPTEASRRLLGFISSSELGNALESLGSHTSGSKAVRLERVLTERLPTGEILRKVALATLRDICRESGASVSGNKDELIERIITHFAQGRDQVEEEIAEPPKHEPRRLDEARFKLLFGCLQHQELSDILRRFAELRQSGSKEIRIATLWSAHLSEETLLSQLMNRDLEEILYRLDLRLSGSKSERIARIISHFAGVEGADSCGPETETIPHATPTPTVEFASIQEQFGQRASSSQGALQGWLEQILEATGQVRCYATEVGNPTQQLKNKLSQAVAARGGLLVLTLASDEAFVRARDALIERWGSNDEWMKSVSCVALAYPLSRPVIRAIVEWTDSPWPERIRSRLFPGVNEHRARGSPGSATTGASKGGCDGDGTSSRETLMSPTCGHCGRELPLEARFCPQCGKPTSRSFAGRRF
jgi:hypothetical protein